MDLQALVSLEDQQSARAGQRQAQAQEMLRFGIECLHEARAEDYQDPELLAEACEHLLEAIRHNRSDPEPYIGMGYLLWIACEYTDALLYLSEAILLDPQNSDARELVKLNQQALKAQSAQAVVNAPIDDYDGIDEYDLRYEALEARIQDEVKQLSARDPAWLTVSEERARLERMERQFGNLTRTRSEIEHEIEFLAEELDCEALTEMLRPLDTYLRRAGEAIERSGERIWLHETLARHQKWLGNALRGPGLPADFSQADFEQLLNDCDTIADRLDTLEPDSGVEFMIKGYERMINQVGKLQDLIDAQMKGTG